MGCVKERVMIVSIALLRMHFRLAGAMTGYRISCMLR